MVFPSSTAAAWVVSVASSSGFASDPKSVTISGTRQSFEEYHEGSMFGADIEVSSRFVHVSSSLTVTWRICTAWVALQLDLCSTLCWSYGRIASKEDSRHRQSGIHSTSSGPSLLCHHSSKWSEGQICLDENHWKSHVSRSKVGVCML